MSRRAEIKKARRWVIKLGSALLTNDGKDLDTQAIASWVKQVAALAKSGIEVVIVSSGAVAAGMHRLGLHDRQLALHEKQAAAAVGQTQLVQAWELEFQRWGLKTAQVLLDHDDLGDRTRYLNARSTIRTLMDYSVIPIVNENDTVVTDEIRFGDNDTLGALVANLIEADLLCILTDQDGMYNADPRKDANAEIIRESSALDSKLDAMAGDGGALGRGGMASKLRAARVAARSGASTVIVGGRLQACIEKVAQGDELGTLLFSEEPPIAARKRWLAGQLQSRGMLIIDAGAVKALKQKGRSLLPVGVSDVKGRFLKGELVVCSDQNGVEIARGLINYGSDECKKIMGSASGDIENILGYRDYEELIHRDNLILV